MTIDELVGHLVFSGANGVDLVVARTLDGTPYNIKAVEVDRDGGDGSYTVWLGIEEF